MKTYRVTVETSIVVEAENEFEAEHLAYNGDIEDYDGWTLVDITEMVV
jgi:hypothetical protein